MFRGTRRIYKKLRQQLRDSNHEGVHATPAHHPLPPAMPAAPTHACLPCSVKCVLFCTIDDTQVQRLRALGNHRAVVVLPYAVLTVAISELYAMGLPMFVPSLELIASLRRNGSVDYVYAYDRVISRPPGLNSHNTEFLPCCAGCPLSFTNVSLPTQHPRSSHPFSPEDDSVEARRYWLQFADYYRWPHVTQFSSFADLATKLRASNLTKTHQRMMAYNKERLQVCRRRSRRLPRFVGDGRRW